MTPSAILQIKKLDFPWITQDPFLFCVHHLDFYPEGNEQLGKKRRLRRRRTTTTTRRRRRRTIIIIKIIIIVSAVLEYIVQIVPYWCHENLPSLLSTPPETHGKISEI